MDRDLSVLQKPQPSAPYHQQQPTQLQQHQHQQAPIVHQQQPVSHQQQPISQPQRHQQQELTLPHGPQKSAVPLAVRSGQAAPPIVENSVTPVAVAGKATVRLVPAVRGSGDASGRSVATAPSVGNIDQRVVAAIQRGADAAAVAGTSDSFLLRHCLTVVRDCKSTESPCYRDKYADV
jgi:hypothetical protein